MSEPYTKLANFEKAYARLKEGSDRYDGNDVNSPKRILREAFATEIIGNEELWLSMLDDRNATVHIYNEMTAIRICQDIKEKYVSAFGELVERIRERLSE